MSLVHIEMEKYIKELVFLLIQSVSTEMGKFILESGLCNVNQLVRQTILLGRQRYYCLICINKRGNKP